MNAITYVRTTTPDGGHERPDLAASAALADVRLGIVMELLGDEMGALYAPRRPLSDADTERATRLRGILVAVAHARNLLAPMLMGRVQ